MNLAFKLFVVSALVAIDFFARASVLLADDGMHPVYRVGVSLPLTGDLAEYGNAVKNGIELAKHKFPSDFEHLDLVYDDNRYEAKSAIAVLQDFQHKKVDLIYSWGEVPFNAIAPLVERAGLPLTAYSLDQRAAQNSRFIVLTSNDPKSLTAPLVDYLRKQSFKKLGIIQTEDPYIHSCIEGLRNNLNSSETIDIVSTVLPSETDLKPYALRAKASKVDVVGIYLYPGQISSIYRSLEGMNASLSTFGTDIFESRREISAAGKAIENAVYPNFKIPDTFLKEYLERFKEDAQVSYAFNAYAWAVIAAKTLSESTSKLSASQIISAFRSVKGDEGKLTFNLRKSPRGVYYYEFPVIVRKILNGKFETISN